MEAARSDQADRTARQGQGATAPYEAGRGSGSGQPADPATDPNRTAAEICREVHVGARARKLLDAELKPGQYLARLVEHRLYADAVRYMAHALLNREAVWWACLCARSEVADLATLPALEQQALGAAVHWVLEPNEILRQAAGRAAAAVSASVGGLTPGGAAARAASFALGQSDSPGPGAIPPMPIQAARLAASGVLLASARGPAAGASASARLRRFITLGLDVAYGNNRWD